MDCRRTCENDRPELLEVLTDLRECIAWKKSLDQAWENSVTRVRITLRIGSLDDDEGSEFSSPNTENVKPYHSTYRLEALFNSHRGLSSSIE